MSQEREPAPPFNPVKLIPLKRPPATPEPPVEEDQPAAEPEPGFSTTSLELASYLVLTGHPIVRITGPRTHRKITFKSVSQEDRLAYYNGASAPARALFEAWHSLRHGLMNLLD